MLYKIAVSLVMWMLRHVENAVEERSQGKNKHESKLEDEHCEVDK